MRYAELKPEIPATMFPRPRSPIHKKTQNHLSQTQKPYETILSCSTDIKNYSPIDALHSDEFIEDEIDDEDLLEVGILTYFVKFLARNAHII